MNYFMTMISVSLPTTLINMKKQKTLNKVKIELSVNILEKLLQQGAINIEDCRSLDSESKKVLWKSLLKMSCH